MSGCRAGLHGRRTGVYIFRDELFIFPYINFQRPWLAAALLEYRYARLGARLAQWRAKRARGVRCFGSGSNGREETQRLHLNPISGRWLPDRSHLQRHVNVAATAWQEMLGGDPVPWLLSQDEPAARWVTLTAVLDQALTDPAVLEARETVGIISSLDVPNSPGRSPIASNSRRSFLVASH